MAFHPLDSQKKTIKREIPGRFRYYCEQHVLDSFFCVLKRRGCIPFLSIVLHSISDSEANESLWLVTDICFASVIISSVVGDVIQSITIMVDVVRMRRPVAIFCA